MKNWNLIKLNCKTCGRFFWVFPSRVKKGAKCCSQRCWLKYLNKLRNTNTTIKCVVCGRIKRVWPARVRVGQKCCSYKCMGIYRNGKNNPAWNGGTAYEPYGKEFNDELKEKIRKRDNYICQLCGIMQNGRAHPIHHIDYNKKNNHEFNLITLCHSCHNKTNSHREYWKNHFGIMPQEAHIQ